LEISHYNSFYEIFAGIAAALVGIEQITNIILSRIRLAHSTYLRQMEKHLQKMEREILASQYLLTYNDALEDETAPKALQRKYKRDYRRLVAAKTKCVNRLTGFNRHDEMTIIKYKTPRICLYIFVYLLILVTLAGLEQDQIVKHACATAGTFTLCSVIAIELISYGTSRDNSFSMRTCAITPFLLIIPFATYCELQLIAIPTPEFILVSSTLAFVIYAFYKIYCRALNWLFITYPIESRKAKKFAKQSSLVEARNLILRN
jgi:hypothetical protein